MHKQLCFDKAISLILKNVKTLSKEERRDVVECFKEFELFNNLRNYSTFQSRLFLFLEDIKFEKINRGKVFFQSQSNNKVYFILKGKIGVFHPGDQIKGYKWNYFVEKVSRMLRLNEAIDFEEELRI